MLKLCKAVSAAKLQLPLHVRPSVCLTQNKPVHCSPIAPNSQIIIVIIFELEYVKLQLVFTKANLLSTLPNLMIFAIFLVLYLRINLFYIKLNIF